MSKLEGGTSCANAPMQFNSFDKDWEHNVLYLWIWHNMGRKCDKYTYLDYVLAARI